MTPPSRRTGALAAGLLALVVPVVIAPPAWASSTANEVVYTADDDNDGAYTVVLRDLESRRVTTVLPELFVDDPDAGPFPVIYDDPELSPDGSRIAMSTDRGSAEAIEGIALVGRDGSGFVRVTNPPAPATAADGRVTSTIDVGVAWSPRGDRLAFTRITITAAAAVDCDETPEQCTIDTAVLTVPAQAGATPTPLAGAENGYTADWSPAGDKIVFADVPDPVNQDAGALTVVNSDGSGGRLALGPSGLLPAWSPDGSTIAYSTVTALDGDRARAYDTVQIATVPATGGTERRLAATQPTGEPTVAEYATWTPDSESILFDLYGYSTTDDFPPGDLWAVDRAGVRAGKVTATPGDDAQPHVQGPAPAAVSAGSESTYVPVTPKRVLDTRNGLGVPAAKVGPAGTVELAVRGLQTAPTAVPADATAVVLNVTVTGTTATTDVRAYPSGTGVPGASSLNAGAGQTVPNLVTVAIGSNGGVVLRNSAGTVHLIADVAGYYVPGTRGAGFAALDPKRIADTRQGVGCVSNKVPAGGFCDLQVTGVGGVPAGATAVVLNVTATGASAGTDVRVYPTPTDGAVPEVSNLNLRAGQTVPNLVTVAIGAGGKVRLRNAAGNVDLIADLAGYYAPSATGRFVPVTPARFLDTRSGIGGAPIPVTAAGFVDLKVAGTRGVPAGASAAVLNLTGTGVSASTDVRAYPAGAASVPEVSNLNLVRGTTRANSAIVKVGTDGRVRVRNAAGQLNLIGDLAGYMVG